MILKSEENEIEKGAAEYENAIHQTGTYIFEFMYFILYNIYNKCLNFKLLINILGFGRYNLSLIFLCGASILTVLVETLGIAYILPAAQCDLNLTISDKSIISSVGFLGMLNK